MDPHENEPSKTVWVGLVEVSGPPENEFMAGGIGAIGHVVAIATDEESFRLAACIAAKNVGLAIQSIEDAEPVAARIRTGTMVEELINLSARTAVDGETRFSQLHSWPGDS